MPSDVEPITLRTCVHAVTGTVTGWVRPRRPDPRVLAGLADVGLPHARATVRLSVLPHSTRPAPAMVIEGVRRFGGLTMAFAPLLIAHPRRRILVDPGICRQVRRRAVADVQTPLRWAIMPPADPLDIGASLAAAGIAVPDIDSALVTHLHWDHVSGLLDLPGLALQVDTREWAWAMRPGPAPAGGVRSAVLDRPVTRVDLDGPAVLTFPSSHDLMGDGSIVLVDLAGHTPGSIGILLHTVEGWVLLVGDAAWHWRQVEEIRQKAAFPGVMVDEDRERAWLSLMRVHVASRKVLVVPAHDPTSLR